MVLLNAQSITTSYGATQVLFGVDLNVEEGEVVALLGRNGMGKSTSIRAICGLNKVSSGAVTFDGSDITGLPSHKSAQMGLGLVPEGRRCFPNLTVGENLLASARSGQWTIEGVQELFPRLEERQAQMANTLSGGEQQMLAIARALMTNPKLLILDEATEGLAPVIRDDIWRVLKTLKDKGQAILLVDKSLREVMSIAGRCVLLEKGKTVWSGHSNELKADLQHRYLGV
ncbi:MAG: ABC transporter ATP-binding protein [Hyphomicrobiales bacterium]